MRTEPVIHALSLPSPRRVCATLAVCALIATAVGCTTRNAPSPTSEPTSVPVLTVSSQHVTAYETYPAKLSGTVNSAVRPKSAGYVTEVLVDEGQHVTKGQRLFKLETRALDGEAGAARANVNAARVEVSKLEPLVAKSIISEVELQSARARLEQAESNYNSIAANIGYANIQSPVDGIVGTINYRRGALVGPGDDLPLTRVSSIDLVYANFSMNEAAFLSFVLDVPGDTMEEKISSLPPVTLILANGQEYEHLGTIETIAGEIDQATGTVAFRARFDNSSGLLRNGSSGTVKIPQPYEGVVVPRLSTFEQQGSTFVYVVQGDTIVATPLDIAASVDNLYVLRGGLDAGAQIVARGATKLKPSTKVVGEPVTLESIMESVPTVFR